MKEIKGKVLSAMRDDEKREALQKIVEYEEKEKERKKQLGIDKMFWEHTDVRVKPHLLKEMYMDDEVLDMPFGSSSGTNQYCLADRETTKEVLNSFGESHGIQESKEKIEDIEVDLSAFDRMVEVRAVDRQIKRVVNRAADQPGIHVKLVGGPGTGKSLVMSCLEDSTRATWVSGSDMTKASVRDHLLEDRPRFLLIDEIDDYNNKEAVQVLSEPMEDQTLSVQVSGKEAERVSMPINVFATANVNNLPDHIEDRFLPIRLPQYSDEEFRELIMRSFPEHEDIQQNIAEAVVDKCLTHGIKSYRRARSIANICDEPQDVDWIFEVCDF